VENGAEHDDWRVAVEVADHATGQHLLGRVREHRLEAHAEEEVLGDVEHLLAHRVVLSHDGPRIFAYAATRSAADAAQRALIRFLDQHGLQGTVTLNRWHPVEERWEDADVPLPETSEALASESERLRDQERRDSERIGVPEWEVRVEFPTHRETVEFAQRLRAEGLPCLRRWRFLLIGAESEADAAELAQRIQREAPSDARVLTEGSAAIAYSELHPALFTVVPGGEA
jgi:hypothetical protein